MARAKRRPKSRTKAKAKSKAKTKASEKPKELVNPSAARKDVLGRISKPYKNAVSQLLVHYRLCLRYL
jgi:hypothetical protein